MTSDGNLPIPPVHDRRHQTTHALAIVTIAVAASALSAQAPATPESLLVAAKRAAGQDHAGTFLRICVAPDNAPGGGGGGARGGPPPGANTVPDRATWYPQPYKVFDNLYFVGTRIHSAWALTTSQGIVIIDTLFAYVIEPEIIDGLAALKLNPRDIKYVLISHAHGDHDQGAALLQARYGAKVVMGEADWTATLQPPATAAGGVPKRDITVGADGTMLTLGDTTIQVVATPGHTPGTLSYIFPVRDRGRRLMVAYSGGTAFNFPRQAETFAVYRDSQRRFADAARAADATVLMSNHTEFDRAYDRVRLAQLPRAAGEKHPYDGSAHGAALLRNDRRLRRSAASPLASLSGDVHPRLSRSPQRHRGTEDAQRRSRSIGSVSPLLRVDVTGDRRSAAASSRPYQQPQRIHAICAAVAICRTAASPSRSRNCVR